MYWMDKLKLKSFILIYIVFSFFLSKKFQNNHPHVVFEAKSLGRQTCGNKRGFEWNMPSGLSGQGGSSDYSIRRGEDKGPQYFIELAILLDRAMVSCIRILCMYL